MPHLVDFALRTCADAAHHPPTNGVDSLSPYTHPPITHPYGLSQSMQVRQWDAHPRLRPIDGRRLLPHRYVKHTTWLGLGWLLPHRCTRTHARMYHAFVGRTRTRADACAHVTCSVCVCRTCVHGAGPPRLHARPHAACSSRLGPQQALASAGLGFERRLSAAVLDRACPDWRRPHSQATARCMARCMARRSQGAGWSQGGRWSSGGPMGVSTHGQSEGARKARGGRRYPPE